MSRLVKGKRMWQCGKCKSWKQAREFYKCKHTKNGRKSYCKKCHIENYLATRDVNKVMDNHKRYKAEKKLASA